MKQAILSSLFLTALPLIAPLAAGQSSPATLSEAPGATPPQWMALSNWERLKVGMKGDQIRAILGAPTTTADTPDTDVWTYMSFDPNSSASIARMLKLSSNHPGYQPTSAILIFERGSLSSWEAPDAEAVQSEMRLLGLTSSDPSASSGRAAKADGGFHAEDVTGGSFERGAAPTGATGLPGWAREDVWTSILQSNRLQPAIKLLGPPSGSFGGGGSSPYWGSYRLGLSDLPSWRESPPTGQDNWTPPPLDWLRGVGLAQKRAAVDLPNWITPEAWLAMDAILAGVPEGGATKLTDARVLELLGEPTSKTSNLDEVRRFGQRVFGLSNWGGLLGGSTARAVFWLYEFPVWPEPIGAVVAFKERDDPFVVSFVAPNWSSVEHGRLAVATKQEFGSGSPWLRLELARTAAISREQRTSFSRRDKSSSERLEAPNEVIWSKTASGCASVWTCTWNFDLGASIEWTTSVPADEPQPSGVDERDSRISKAIRPAIPAGLLAPEEESRLTRIWQSYETAAKLRSEWRDQPLLPAYIQAIASAGEPAEIGAWTVHSSEPTKWTCSWKWTDGSEVRWVRTWRAERGATAPSSMRNITDVRAVRGALRLEDVRPTTAISGASSKSPNSGAAWESLEHWMMVEPGDHARWALSVLGEPETREQQSGALIFTYPGWTRDGVRWRGGRLEFVRTAQESEGNTSNQIGAAVRAVVPPSIIAN